MSDSKKKELTIGTLDIADYDSCLFVPIHLLTKKKGSKETFFRVKTKRLANKHVYMKRPRNKGARHIKVFGVICPDGRVKIIKHKRIILKNWEYIIVT